MRDYKIQPTLAKGIEYILLYAISVIESLLPPPLCHRHLNFLGAQLLLVEGPNRPIGSRPLLHADPLPLARAEGEARAAEGVEEETANVKARLGTGTERECVT